VFFIVLRTNARALLGHSEHLVAVSYSREKPSVNKLITGQIQRQLKIKSQYKCADEVPVSNKPQKTNKSHPQSLAFGFSHFSLKSEAGGGGDNAK